MGTDSCKKFAVIASSKTWIEGAAVQQLETTAQLPGMHAVAGMPDLHPGRGYPVGAAFFSTGVIYPALVGNDIGCGMSFYQTNMPKHKWSGTKLAEKLGNIDGPVDKSFLEPLELSEISDFLNYSGFGTIGGGNHFAEVQQLDELFVDTSSLKEHYAWLNPKALQLLIHSGSRGIGEQILRSHIDQFGHKGIIDGDKAFEDYFIQHDKALKFANVNRDLIAQRMLSRWRCEGTQILNVHHNFVEKTLLDGVAGYMHRKGATPSDRGLVIIPGSRGDYSYLVKPSPKALSLYSLAHGAGRKWMRSDCEGKLGKGLRFEELLSANMNNTVVCNDKALMFEEAPQAYKKIDSIIESLEQFGLIEKIARFKPIMTYKTSGGCAC